MFVMKNKKKEDVDKILALAEKSDGKIEKPPPSLPRQQGRNFCDAMPLSDQRGGKMKEHLLIINDSPYGNERPYDALRVAMNLAKRKKIK